jgi:hypothetical protein
VANTLAYYNMATITAVKSFIVQARILNCHRKFVYHIGRCLFVVLPKFFLKPLHQKQAVINNFFSLIRTTVKKKFFKTLEVSTTRKGIQK